MLPKFYSQYGQDYILYKMFDGKPNGFFVEVGCADGIQLSNSLMFEQIGWKGMCIEPHPKFCALLRINRPNSIVCENAVADKESHTVTFYGDPTCFLSSLDVPDEESLQKNYGTSGAVFTKYTVRQTTLQKLFDKYSVGEIDFLSLDIEGAEERALRGMDLGLVAPRVLIVEAKSRLAESKIFKLIRYHGYRRSIRIGSDSFYTREKALHQRVSGKVFSVELNLSSQSQDREKGTKIHKVKIDTRSNGLNTLRKKIRWYAADVPLLREIYHKLKCLIF